MCPDRWKSSIETRTTCWPSWVSLTPRASARVVLPAADGPSTPTLTECASCIAATIPPSSSTNSRIGQLSVKLALAEGRANATIAPVIEEVLRQINALHGTYFRLRGRYPVGEMGAFGLVDGTGTPFVLKWSPRPAHLALIEAAARATDQLRPLGYPTPTYVLWGAIPRGCFCIQGTLPGRPAALTSLVTVDQLVALSDLQLGRGGWLIEAFSARPRWADEIIEAVTDGFAEQDYCVISSMRSHSPATSELLDVVQGFVEQHADDISDDYVDVVHYDFSPANLLLDEQQRVVGVVDWEGVRAGDRVFDLATQMFYATNDGDVQRRLQRAALERGRPGVLGIYLCHLIVRQVDFSIRHHGSAEVEQWLDHASGLLSVLEQLGR